MTHMLFFTCPVSIWQTVNKLKIPTILGKKRKKSNYNSKELSVHTRVSEEAPATFGLVVAFFPGFGLKHLLFAI